jgi:hypothetical protein
MANRSHLEFFISPLKVPKIYGGNWKPQAYSAVIRSSFGTKLWMLRCRNEIDEENIALIPEQKNKKWIVNKYTFKINE